MKINPSLPFNYSSPSRSARSTRGGAPAAAHNSDAAPNSISQTNHSQTTGDPAERPRIPAASKSDGPNPGQSQSRAKAVQTYSEASRHAESATATSSATYESVQRINTRLGRDATSVYAQHQSLDERDQVSQSLGIDTYA